MTMRRDAYDLEESAGEVEGDAREEVILGVRICGEAETVLITRAPVM